MPNGEESLRVAIATLRADHAALGLRVGGVETDLRGIRHDLNEKHKENRADIHGLRNGQQDIIDLVHKIDLKLAKFAGYAAGAGAAVALLIEVIQHLWK